MIKDVSAGCYFPRIVKCTTLSQQPQLYIKRSFYYKVYVSMSETCNMFSDPQCNLTFKMQHCTINHHKYTYINKEKL